MSCWGILGLAQTTDKKAIKRAYAKKLKELTIDEQIAEFQQLKAAFDQALNQSSQQEIPASHSQTLDPEVSIRLSLPVDPNQEEMVKLSANRTAHPLAEEPEWLAELRAEVNQELLASQAPTSEQAILDFLAGQSYFDEVEKWYQLLTPFREASIEEFERKQYFLCKILSKYYFYFDKKIVGFFLDVIQLEGTLASPDAPKSSAYYLKYYQQAIENVPAFSFAMWAKIPTEQRETYFAQRYQLYQMAHHALDCDFKDFQQKMAAVRAIFNQDSTLDELEALAYLLRKRDTLSHFDATYLALVERGYQQPFGNKQWLHFLALYDEVWNARAISSEQQAKLAKLLLTIPLDCQPYVKGLLPFKRGLLEEAFAAWQQLSESQAEHLIPLLKANKKALDKVKKGGRYLESHRAWRELAHKHLQRKSIRFALVVCAVEILAVIVLTLWGKTH